jgi:hypothetical protein
MVWFFSRKQPRSTGWYRERHTGEVERVVHQREKPVYEPLPERPPALRTAAWVAGQLRDEEPVRQTGAMTPIPASDTEGIPRLPMPKRSPRTIHGVEDIPTVKQLPGLPAWLVAKHPLGLHVSRGLSDAATPEQRQASANDAAIDAMLMTLPPERLRDRERAIDPIVYADIPTVVSRERRAILDLPPPPADWTDDVVLQLAELPGDAIAATDRTANNVAEIRVWAEPEETGALAELMRHDSATLELPSVTAGLAEKHKKESE